MTEQTPLSIECLQHDRSFESLQGVWQALERLDTECSPFNTWLWLSLWWRHYSLATDTLAILIAKQGSRVVAIAPFYIERGRMCRVVPVAVLRFIGSGRDTSPDYLNIVSLPTVRQQAEKAFLEYLPKVPGWQKLYLSDIRESSGFFEQARRFVGAQPGVLIPLRKNIILRATLPASWEEYRMGLSRKRRKQINHRNNRLHAAGDSELSLCADIKELNKAMDALATLHRQRWQSKGEEGAFNTDSYEQFHRAVIEGFFHADALWLATLRLNGEIIGVQYIFVWRGELLFFQSGYSPDHEALSPGHVLFTYVIERAIEQGITGIDMLKGHYDYKSAYAREESVTCDVGFIKSGARGMIGYTLGCASAVARRLSRAA